MESLARAPGGAFHLQRLGVAVFLVAVLACTGVAPARDDADPSGSYTSNTPYQPAQDSQTYEPPPPGFQPIFTQLVARHGSRALTSATNIDFVKQVIIHARRDDALTELGQLLEPEVLRLEQANVELGYGNLSRRGKREHRELAARLLARLPGLFVGAVQAERRVSVLDSGKDRAVDSGQNFVESLSAHLPALGPLIDPTVSDTDLLYFHKAPQNADYQEWLAHDPTLKAKLNAIFYGPESHRQARRLLVRLFNSGFVDRLAAGALPFTQGGEPVAFNEVDAAASLWSLYQITAGLSDEGPWHFDRFVHGGPARWFAYLSDSGQFYEKGPSFAGATITFKMAQVLQDDFFAAVESLRGLGRTHVARLRFTHAEIVIPLAALMQLPYSDLQVPVADDYTYAENPWRGFLVTPYAVNIQWDVYEDAAGQVLIRMLYNEKQTRFKSTCRSIGDASDYYSFDELKRCYGYPAP